MDVTATAQTMYADNQVAGIAIFVAVLFFLSGFGVALVISTTGLFTLMIGNLFGRIRCGACEGSGLFKSYKYGDGVPCKSCNSTGFLKYER